ncbi:MAG: ATP-binding protein [Candidatus Saccharimonas sp.]
MAVLVAFYIWGALRGTTPLNRQILVPMLPAGGAVLTLLVGIILYFKAPTNRLQPYLFVVYCLALATLTGLVGMTDGMHSAFFSLLVIAVACGGFFTTAGVLVSFSVIAGIIVYNLVVLQLDLSEVITLGAIMLVPTIGGYILWARLEEDSPEVTTEDRAYNELASELSEVAGKSEVVINAITDGVIALNGQGMIQLINPAAQQMLGWTKHDALTLSYKSILKILNTKNEVIAEGNDPVAQAIATNKVIKSDSFSLETQSGKSFLASISVSPVGQLGNGVIIVFRDVTTEKSDERQRAEFISTASHEMRTPVASIEGYLGLALNPATATIDAKARDFITKAHESAEHLGRLFSDLLDVTKADDSRLKNDPRIVDVVPFIHDIVEGLTPKATEKGLHVFYKPVPSNDVVVGTRINPVFYANVDNDHLREIVQNLVENAIKYTPAGDVVIDVTGDNEHIIISVADTGIGIPREDQTHLFQKFYRVDSSDTREIGGTGLGLYLCRRLAETIGGRIWIESEYKKGSTFYVELPRTSHDDAIHMIEQASIVAEQRAEAEERQSISQPQVPVSSTEIEASLAPPAIVAPTPIPAPPASSPTPMPTISTMPIPQAVVAPTPIVAAQPTPSAPIIPPVQSVNRSRALDIVVPPRSSK